MDYDRMLEKMNPMNRNMFCILLGVTEPPEVVCKQYFAMKMCLDKISAPITPVDLLRIAMDCGFDVHTRRFVVAEVQGQDIMADTELGDVDWDSAKITQQADISSIKHDKQIPICKAEEVAAATGGSVIEEEPEVEPITIDEVIEEVEGEPNKYEVGDTVQCYIDDDAVEARIQEIKADVVPAVYVVEYGGSTHEITDMEIEEM